LRTLGDPSRRERVIRPAPSAINRAHRVMMNRTDLAGAKAVALAAGEVTS
jgi:hypothetical protein